MQVFLRILKETAIAIVLLGLVVLVVWLLFQKQIPFINGEIPEAIDYAEINLKDFDIQGDIEDETNPTQTFAVTQEQSKSFETDRYVATGTPNPFTSASTTSDVPTERVTIINSANGSSSASTTPSTPTPSEPSTSDEGQASSDDSNGVAPTEPETSGDTKVLEQ